MFDFNNKTVLITGGATGIGFGIAKCYIEVGAKVIIISRNEKNLKKAKEKLKDNCFYFVNDITDFEKTEKLIDKIENKIGKIDILINNAGNHFKKSFLQTDINDFDSVLKTHVYASFNLSKKIANNMIKNKIYGNIIFIASMTSFIGQPLVVSYSAAKSAYLGIVRTLASELAEYNIRVNAIAPGWIKTPMTNKALNSDFNRKQRVLNRTPLKKLGEPEDIGWATVFLSSEKAKFITGITMPVDGGALIGF